jgi:hypothetical protein
MALTLDGTTGISATGNIYGNNVIVTNTLTAGTFSPTSVSAAGNVTGGNILTAGLISATGNITGAFILGNGSQLTGVDATQIVNGTSNAKVISSGGNIAVGIGGTSNISVFATTGQFVTGVMSSTGNGIHGNILTAGLISATSTITSAANVVGGNITTGGLVSSTGNVIGANMLTAGLISATGNITGNFFLGNGSQLTGIDATSIQSGTSNVRVVSSGGNVTTGIGGTSNVVVVATTGQFVTGVNSVSGNITGGNVLTGGLISATGAITGAAMTGTSLTVSTGNITGGNLLLSGAIIDSAQLDIQTSASNSNIALAPNGTGIVTVSTQVSAVGNVTGGNIRTAGLISATGAITGAALTGTSLTVSTGNVSCGNIVNTNANGVGNIGSSSLYFNTVFAKATSAQYADLAEMYAAGAHYEPGTVVIFGGAYEVEISTSSHATTVAGVISTNPSYIMNAGQTGPHVVAVALQGRVPTRVIGNINKGDRMVTSHVPGVATVMDPKSHEPGCIIGKALATYQAVFDDEGNEIPGLIEIVVGRV